MSTVFRKLRTMYKKGSLYLEVITIHAVNICIVGSDCIFILVPNV